MLAIERQNKILEALQKDHKVVVSNLSEIFQVTEETIRRDLEKLEREGIAKKTYGGAVLNQSLNIDLPYTVRKKANVTLKQRIATIANSMIEDGDHIMLDASSTALYIAKQMKHKKNITVITNSIEIILELADITNWRVLSTGGALKGGSLSFTGYQAEKMLHTFHVDKTIVSCKGIDLENGFTDSNEADAHIKQCMLQAAKQRILAVDHTKFNKISFIQVGEFTGLDALITDALPEKEWEEMFSQSNVELCYEEKVVENR